MRAFVKIAPILIVSLFSTSSLAKAPIVIHWKINHHPEKFFTAAVQKMDETVSRLTKGQVRVEAVAAKNASWAVEKEGRISKFLVRNGDIEMTQVYTSQLTEFEPRLGVFDLPFLFESHDHVTAVVESALGEKIVSRLSDYGFQPLAFTYSGGFIAITSRKPIQKLEDFKGLKYRAGENALNLDVFRNLGVQIINTGSLEKNVPPNVYPFQSYFESGAVDAGDCETVDLQFITAKKAYFNVLEHRILNTVLVMNKTFFDSIPKKFHAAIKQAAQEAAREERLMIAAEETRILADLEKQGRVVKPSAPEMKRIREAAMSVYPRFVPLIGQEIIDGVKAQLPKAKIANR